MLPSDAAGARRAGIVQHTGLRHKAPGIHLRYPNVRSLTCEKVREYAPVTRKLGELLPFCGELLSLFISLFCASLLSLFGSEISKRDHVTEFLICRINPPTKICTVYYGRSTFPPVAIIINLPA
jgi:hypothetical protein